MTAMVQTREPQLDQNMQRFHIQSTQEPQPVEMSADMRAPTLQCPLEPIPELHPLLLLPHPDSPVIPPIRASPSYEPRIAISFLSIEAYATLSGIGHFSEHPHLADDSSSCS
ncbi:hypothetical protein CK203_110387 [Vitis vinifera]|uniref:Uncharacterized protein n=1 Tax=Vitis vinifera TaxID=29760 RepID=A0A438FDA0_VITVI|nr:hypothetical protein CK203_110387 [Vitis vinifera]